MKHRFKSVDKMTVAVQLEEVRRVIHEQIKRAKDIIASLGSEGISDIEYAESYWIYALEAALNGNKRGDMSMATHIKNLTEKEE